MTEAAPGRADGDGDGAQHPANVEQHLSNASATAANQLSQAGQIVTQGKGPAWAVQLQLVIDRLQEDMKELKKKSFGGSKRGQARKGIILGKLREHNRNVRDCNRFAVLSSGHLTGLKRMPDLEPLVEGVPAPPEPNLLDPPPDFPTTFDSIDFLSHREIEALLTAYGQEVPQEIREARRAFKEYVSYIAH